jgi:choline kinase
MLPDKIQKIKEFKKLGIKKGAWVEGLNNHTIIQIVSNITFKKNVFRAKSSTGVNNFMIADHNGKLAVKLIIRPS